MPLLTEDVDLMQDVVNNLGKAYADALRTADVENTSNTTPSAIIALRRAVSTIVTNRFDVVDDVPYDSSISLEAVLHNSQKSLKTSNMSFLTTACVALNTYVQTNTALTFKQFYDGTVRANLVDIPLSGDTNNTSVVLGEDFRKLWFLARNERLNAVAIRLTSDGTSWEGNVMLPVTLDGSAALQVRVTSLAVAKVVKVTGLSAVTNLPVTINASLAIKTSGINDVVYALGLSTDKFLTITDVEFFASNGTTPAGGSIGDDVSIWYA